MYGEPIILNSFTVFNIFIYVIIMLISLVNYCLGNKLWIKIVDIYINLFFKISEIWSLNLKYISYFYKINF
jgi:hypothetical protein